MLERPIEVTHPNEQQRLKDAGELAKVNWDLVTYARVAIVQKVRRRPALQAGIERFARIIGRPIDLSKPLA